jgi:fructose-1-phosphate kinase PfkB-like protein
MVAEGDAAESARVLESKAEIASAPLQAAFAARDAGAAVTFLCLAEPAQSALVGPMLRQRGIGTELLEVPRVGLQETCYFGADGAVRFWAVEPRLPSPPEIDRLLDRIESLLPGAALIVVAGDLEGARRQDFAERVIGRAWGLGVKTILARPGESLKQAFHAYPLGAFVPEEELPALAPADPKDPEEPIQRTLERIFTDPVQVLVLRRADGTVAAATRAGTDELGMLRDVDPGALMGALAAHWDRARGDERAAARAAFAQVTRDRVTEARG